MYCLKDSVEIYDIFQHCLFILGSSSHLKRGNSSYGMCQRNEYLFEPLPSRSPSGGPSTDSLNETTKNGGGFFTRFFGASSTTVSPVVAPPVGCKG